MIDRLSKEGQEIEREKFVKMFKVKEIFHKHLTFFKFVKFVEFVDNEEEEEGWDPTV
jgi:hypothetical protein